MRRVIFWLLLVFWCGVEVYLLRVALSAKPGTDLTGAIGLILLWGFPSSIIVAFISAILPFDFGSKTGCIALWIVFCGAGALQWYFVVSWLDSTTERFYRRFRSVHT
jgi:hypothetical protein